MLCRLAQKRGIGVAVAGMLCFCAAFISSVVVFKQFPLETVGAVFAILGGAFLWQDYRFFKRAVIVSGVVTNYAKHPGSDGRSTYAPVVQFEFDGQTRQVTGDVYSSGKPKMGKVMKVGVDPQNIQEARVSQQFVRIICGIFFVVGVVILLSSVYTYCTAG